eukprot:766082-Hanusia_phi.AAC.6
MPHVPHPRISAPHVEPQLLRVPPHDLGVQRRLAQGEHEGEVGQQLGPLLVLRYLRDDLEGCERIKRRVLAGGQLGGVEHATATDGLR